jgi:hypothetical protein
MGSEKMHWLNNTPIEELQDTQLRQTEKKLAVRIPKFSTHNRTPNDSERAISED